MVTSNLPEVLLHRIEGFVHINTTAVLRLIPVVSGIMLGSSFKTVGCLSSLSLNSCEPEYSQTNTDPE